MKTEFYLTQLTEQIYAIEVPEDADNFVIDMGYLIWKIVDKSDWVTDKQIEEDVVRFLTTGKSKFSDLDTGIKRLTGGIPLPPGNYSFLFCSLNCTEEQAASVVESEELFINGRSQGVLHAVYYNNGKVLADVCEWYNSAKDSLQSLLRSKGLNPELNYCLIKKL